MGGGRVCETVECFHAEQLDELRANCHKVLVFSQFVKHLKLIEGHLVGADTAYPSLDGSMPVGARAERIAAFQAGQGDVFLISLEAGGVGLNLTAADYVIHMGPWWDPTADQGRVSAYPGPRNYSGVKPNRRAPDSSYGFARFSLPILRPAKLAMITAISSVRCAPL